MWEINDIHQQITLEQTKQICKALREGFSEYEEHFKKELSLIFDIKLILGDPTWVTKENLEIIQKYYDCTVYYDHAGRVINVTVNRRTTVPIDENDFKKLMWREE